MLTLEQLILEATALPDAGKAILIDKIVESMTGEVDRDILMEGVQKAQERLAEIDSGTVQKFCMVGLVFCCRLSSTNNVVRFSSFQ
jgi:Putative addiction module component